MSDIVCAVAGGDPIDLRATFPSGLKDEERERIAEALESVVGSRYVFRWSAASLDGAPLVAGDVVRLKCGGPPLVVEHVEADGTAGCVWFDTVDHAQRAHFAVTSLVRAPEVRP